MSTNPFLAVDDALKAQVEEISERLRRLSGVLPAASQADVDSHYAQADGVGVEETQRLLLERTGFVCIMARLLGWGGAPLTMGMVRDIHEGIFRPVFGEATLGFREPPNRGEYRDDDGVQFPIWVTDGPRMAPRVRVVHGVRASQVLKRVEHACGDFEKRSLKAGDSPQERALLLARLYVRLIRTHPFGDGNGRTAWAALQLAAGRMKFPLVQSTPTMEARLALGSAILNGQRIDALVEHIKRAAWEGT